MVKIYEQEKTTIEVKLSVELERFSDVLCNALEGGSNYWYMIEESNRKKLGCEFVHEVPFLEGGFIIFSDLEDGNTRAELNKSIIIKGIQTMSTKYLHHFTDIINESDDGTTADVFLQCCLFGDIIYG